MKANPKCAICRKSRVELFYRQKNLTNETIVSNEVLCTGELGSRGRHAKIWQCRKCGLIFQEPSFSKTELAYAYEKGEDERYFEQEKQRIAKFNLCLTKIEKFIKPKGKLLDVGVGCGLSTFLAKKRGWKVNGLEPSFWGVAKAKEKFGLRIKQGTFENINWPKESFDIVTMWDVLEHFENPLKVLSKSHDLLKNDGLLVLDTINIDSWFSKLLGKHWTWLIRVHLWYFTTRTLRLLLENAGFEIIYKDFEVRSFSLPYLVSRLTGYNFNWLPKLTLPAPTNDIIFVIAKKLRSR